jgi:photosystem II stability/assembly factor-like uncharacterized protein
MKNIFGIINQFSNQSLFQCLLGMMFTFTSCVTFASLTIDLPSWQLQQMKGNPSLRGAAILKDSLWVTGSNNSVFVSQDGGKTWHDKSVKSTINSAFRDITLFNSHTAIVMGIGSGESSTLYKTTDGGNNWNLLYQNTDEHGFFDSIGFWDRKKGLLLGDPVDGYYVVKKTEDGGKTWRRIAKNKLPKMLDKEVAFAASGYTLITGKKGKAYITTGGFSASVYISDDYGETWQRDAVPLFQETQSAGGYGLALNHNGQPFVLGGDYDQRSKKYSNIATLVNGIWKKVDAGENGLRTAMSCQGNICISTGKTSSDISFNAGSHWQLFPSQQSVIDDNGFYTIDSDEFIFLAAGAKGKVGILSFKR